MGRSAVPAARRSLPLSFDWAGRPAATLGSIEASCSGTCNRRLRSPLDHPQQQADLLQQVENSKIRPGNQAITLIDRSRTAPIRAKLQRADIDERQHGISKAV